MNIPKLIMYRPDDWVNPHQWYDANRALMTFEYNHLEKYKAFEAGATAMLEVVKKELGEICTPIYDNFQQGAMLGRWMDKVFISEEE